MNFLIDCDAVTSIVGFGAQWKQLGLKLPTGVEWFPEEKCTSKSELSNQTIGYFADELSFTDKDIISKNVSLPKGVIKRILYQYMGSIHDKLETLFPEEFKEENIHYFFTGKDSQTHNFRFKLAPQGFPYKNTRGVKPESVKLAYDIGIEIFNTNQHIITGAEADDGIARYKRKYPDSVIVANDKDYTQLVGKYFDLHKSRFCLREFNELEAERNLWELVLKGDAADTTPGLRDWVRVFNPGAEHELQYSSKYSKKWSTGAWEKELGLGPEGVVKHLYAKFGVPIEAMYASYVMVKL